MREGDQIPLPRHDRGVFGNHEHELACRARNEQRQNRGSCGTDESTRRDAVVPACERALYGDECGCGDEGRDQRRVRGHEASAAPLSGL